MHHDLLKPLQTQIEKVSRMEFYKRKLEQAGVMANSIQSFDDFRKVPFTSSKEILEELKKKPSECSLFSQSVTRFNFSPSGQDLFPVYNTNQDLQKMHEVAARAYTETLLAFNEIRLSDHLPEGPVVEDQRQGRTF